MAGKIKNKLEVELGCSFMARFFNLKNNKLRKSSVHSLPMKASNNNSIIIPQHKEQGKNDAKRPQILEPNKVQNPIPTEPHSARKSTSSSAYRNSRPSDAARSSIQQSQDSSEESNHNLQLARISTSHQPQRETNEGKSPALKITGNLLMNNSPRNSVTKSQDCAAKNKELNTLSSSYRSNGVMGNIMRKGGDEVAQFRSPRTGRGADPEVLKHMGNEAYKQGRFGEALALYDRAIALDSNKATYHCNKSAALIGLGRFVQAIVECEEAIRLEPSYGRAHSRLATIYFRYSNDNEYDDNVVVIGFIDFAMD